VAPKSAAVFSLKAFASRLTEAETLPGHINMQRILLLVLALAAAPMALVCTLGRSLCLF